MVNEPTWPASDLKVVVKSDTTVHTPPLRMLYVGTGGDVTVLTQQGTTVTFKNVSDGQNIGPFYVSRILAATTAADIIGFE